MVLSFDRQTLNIEQPIADGSVMDLQDLYNQIREWQALHANMDERNFVDGFGKQPLGGTNQVGITLAFFNNWMVGFEGRAGPAVIATSIIGGNLTAQHQPTGTATSTGTTTLTDAAGQFVRCAFQTGDVIRNVTDGSEATITNVVSETVLNHTDLAGGAEDDWDVGETWEVDSAHPVFPSDFVHVTISQDTAPLGLTDLGAANLLRKVFLNKAVTTPDAPSAGEKTIDFYDDDQATIIDTLVISADGNTRTNP